MSEYNIIDESDDKGTGAPRSDQDDGKQSILPEINAHLFKSRFIDRNEVPSDQLTNANSISEAINLRAPVDHMNFNSKSRRKGKPNASNQGSQHPASSVNRINQQHQEYSRIEMVDQQPRAQRSSLSPPYSSKLIGNEHSAKIALNKLSIKRGNKKKPDKGNPEQGEKHGSLHIVQKKNEINLASKSRQVMSLSEQFKQKILNQQTLRLALNNHARLSENKTPSTDPAKVHRLYNENLAYKLHKKLRKSTDYHERVMRKVPLDQLYEVKDYLYYNQEQLFCPVLLEIKNEGLLAQEEQEDQKTQQQQQQSMGFTLNNERRKPYLLQLWRRSDGQLLYERKLAMLPIGWGLSRNDFFYQENVLEDESFEIYQVTYLEEQQEIFVKKIILPEKIKATQNDHRAPESEEDQQQFRLTEDYEKWNKIKEKQKLEESASEAETVPPMRRQSSTKVVHDTNRVLPVGEIHKCQETLNQAHDVEEQAGLKIPLNLGFVAERIIIATKSCLIEVSVKDSKRRLQRTEVLSDQSEIVRIHRDQVKQVAIHGDYEFVQFMDIGLDQSAMVLENPNTNQIRFVLMTTDSEENNGAQRLSSSGEKKNKISYEVLGIVQKQPDIDTYGKSRIIKVVSVQGKVEAKEDSERIFIVSLVLRESGLIEVYSDFELADNFNLAYNDKHLYCVDIAADDESFYFNFLKLNSHDGDFQVRKVNYQWRRRVTYKNSEQYSVNNWQSIRLKNLNMFMKLYSHYEVMQGFFVVAHRNYISLFDMTLPNVSVTLEEDEVHMKTQTGAIIGHGKWREHKKIHKIHHVRDFCLEKDPSIKHLQTNIKDLPTHSVPFRTLYHSFKIRVILTNNEVHKFQTRDQRLTAEPKVDKISGKIVDIYQDDKFGTGTILRTVCGECGLEGEELAEYTARMTHTPISFASDSDLVAGDSKDHLVFCDTVQQARQRCSAGRCYKLLSLNYGQKVLLHPPAKTVEQIAERAKQAVKQAANSYASSLADVQSLQIDGDIRVVNVNKKFWLENLPDLATDSLLYHQLQEKYMVKALLVYQRDKFIKLVPYLQIKQMPDMSKIAEMRVSNELTEEKRLEMLDDNSEIKYSFQLFAEHKVELLDEHACSQVLSGEELLLVRFVQPMQEAEDCSLNSFIVITKRQISVFDPERHEVARISNMNISSALLLDSMYIYIMEERNGNVYEQYSNRESDWELSCPTEIKRICKKEEEGCIAINFAALFKGKFSDLMVNVAATAHNGRIVRCQTNDELCMMQNLHSISVMPIPHWNLLSFTGMRSRSQYLIWKSSADGFFTALSKSGRLNTWSCVTGMQLWSENQNLDSQKGKPSDCSWKNISMYEIYRSDETDTTYLGDYFNFDNPTKPQESYSLSLLVSRNPVYKEATLAEIDSCLPDNNNTVDQAYQDSIVEALLNQTAADLVGFDTKVATTGNMEDVEDLPDAMFQREEDENNSRLGKPRCFSKKMRRMKLYHFQVLRLRQYEDMKRLADRKTKAVGRELLDLQWVPERATGSKVEMIYHFFHKLLHRFHPKQDFEQFDWFLDNQRTKQRLYLSRDAERMCEVIQDRLAIVWKKPKTLRSGQLITWQQDYKISKFPFIAAEVCSLPYFLSDDFSFMCDYDYRKRRLRLLTTRSGNLIKTLPEEALYKPENADEKLNVMQALACVKIVGKDKVCTLNQDNGLYTEWPIVVVKDKRGNPLDRHGNLLMEGSDQEPHMRVNTSDGSSHMMKNIDVIFDFSGQHLLLQPSFGMLKADIFSRIFSRMSTFKLEMSLRKNLKITDPNRPLYYPEVYKPLCSIDYSQSITNPLSTFQLDRSFTLIDWKFAELMESRIDFIDLETEEQLRLMFCAFPQGNSILQMLATTSKAQDSASMGKKMDSVDDCEQIFMRAREGYSVHFAGQDIQTTFNVPLFSNCMGLQPLDYAMGNKKARKAKKSTRDPFNQRFDVVEKEELEMIGSSKNLPLVQAIFANTQENTFMNTSPVKSIIMAVREQLPQAFDYLNSRIIKSNLIKQVLNTEIKSDYMQNCEAWDSYGVIAVDDLTHSKLTQDTLFEKQDEIETQGRQEYHEEQHKRGCCGKVLTEKRQKMRLYDYYWFDVPQIFTQSKEGYAFMEALQKNEDIGVYANPSVQILIVNQWNQWQATNFWMIMMPMVLQLFVFTILTCFCMVNKRNVDKTLMTTLEYVSAVLALYFLLIELIKTVGFFRSTQASSITGKVIFEISIELASPILILIVQINTKFNLDVDKTPDEFWELVAWTSFVTWLRFIFMLRSNEYLSPTISMIMKSFYDMGSYLVIVVLGVLAFANSFTAIRQSAYARAENLSAPTDRDKVVESFFDFHDKWTKEYTSLLFELFIGAAIGLEGDNHDGFTDSQMILFIVAVIFNTIVLMNLLLAVVGGVQGSIAEIAKQHYYKMIVDQICMLQRLFNVPSSGKPKHLLFLTKVKREYNIPDSSEAENQKNANQDIMDQLVECRIVMESLTKKVTKIEQLGKNQATAAPTSAPFAKITSNKPAAIPQMKRTPSLPTDTKTPKASQRQSVAIAQAMKRRALR